MPPTITCYGAAGKIGGNKILLEDGDARILLDFGIDFDRSGMYFNEMLRPRAGARTARPARPRVDSAARGPLPQGPRTAGAVGAHARESRVSEADPRRRRSGGGRGPDLPPAPRPQRRRFLSRLRHPDRVHAGRRGDRARDAGDRARHLRARDGLRQHALRKGGHARIRPRRSVSTAAVPFPGRGRSARMRASSGTAPARAPARGCRPPRPRRFPGRSPGGRCGIGRSIIRSRARSGTRSKPPPAGWAIPATSASTAGAAGNTRAFADGAGRAASARAPVRRDSSGKRRRPDRRGGDPRTRGAPARALRRQARDRRFRSAQRRAAAGLPRRRVPDQPHAAASAEGCVPIARAPSGRAGCVPRPGFRIERRPVRRSEVRAAPVGTRNARGVARADRLRRRRIQETGRVTSWPTACGI